MKIRALVVDDSRSMRRIVMKGLRHAQLAEFDFQEAVDGDDALEKFNPEEYDIVFIDWNMPKMNGIDVVRKIREEPLNDQVKLVMVTSNKTMDFVTEALDDAGANGFISKPFTPKDMRNKLETIIAEIVQIKKAQGGLLGKLFGR
ncbi:MAG: response regulator [Deltaproteobacteria bacterium]|jgi:two-component system, chemotaxis family, chemotaxis protein CheY|nr:response regulator [Deltaproteobacteria bacterium]MBT6436294.1 response regulator [Deltaproteobacteria bacterium]MBT6492188.1 response regulator [Deltaproteobacteria bacterium]